MDATLYRKYRPTTFAEVVGQESAVALLQGALKAKQMPHAYLFSGSRGIGKTSLARIFAHELKIAPADLYEIDAASNRGIDDIRSLRENVRALPYESDYKLYLIDEAHMLTKEAFNALLKTLEEPPAHALFILATTEEHKIPDTILSRCQLVQFERPSVSELSVVLERVAKAEKVKLEPGATTLIAEVADGAFRNALGLLQKIILVAGSDEKITTEEAARVLGAPTSKSITTLLSAITQGDSEAALTALSELFKHHPHPALTLSMLLGQTRAVLLLRVAPAVFKKYNTTLTEEEAALLSELNRNPVVPITSRVLERFLLIARDLPYAAKPQVAFEIALLNVLETATP